MKLCIKFKNNWVLFYLEKRIECFFLFKQHLYYSYSNKIIFKYLRIFLLDTNNNYSKLVLYSIYILDLNFTYKGWRHLFNLPVRGQRTWTNGKSSKNNKKLKNYKKFIFKNYFNYLEINQIDNFVFLEYINLLWKLQWISEWLELRKKRLFILKKKKKLLPIITKEIIFNELKNLNKNLTKKKKISGVLGFDPGLSYIFFK